MECVFCAIGRNEVKAVKLYEDDDIVAFLDRGAIREGHTQIIPKQHYETFDVMPFELAAKILKLGQNLAIMQKKIYGVSRVAFLFTGGDVAHVHAHVVPTQTKYDITSLQYITTPDVRFDDSHLIRTIDELKTVQQKILAAAPKLEA